MKLFPSAAASRSSNTSIVQQKPTPCLLIDLFYLAFTINVNIHDFSLRYLSTYVRVYHYHHACILLALLNNSLPSFTPLFTTTL